MLHVWIANLIILDICHSVLIPVVIPNVMVAAKYCLDHDFRSYLWIVARNIASCSWIWRFLYNFICVRYVLSYSIIFHHISSYSILFHHIPSYSIIFHHFPSYSIIFHHISSYSIRCRNIPSYFIIFHHHFIIFHPNPSYSMIFAIVHHFPS